MLAFLALVVALIRVVSRTELRRWSEGRYLAPLMFGLASSLCLSGVLQLSPLAFGAPVLSAHALVGCGYVALGAFVVWSLRRPTQRRD